MREYRIIAVLTALLLLVVTVYFVRRASNRGAGDFDEVAYTRIAATCGFKPECKVNLGDLFGGDWDTLSLFAYDTPQSELDAAFPHADLDPPGDKRLVILSLHGKVQSRIYEPSNPELYLDHQIVFRTNPNSEDALQLPRNTWLWANRKPSQHETGEFYYVLTPDNR